MLFLVKMKKIASLVFALLGAVLFSHYSYAARVLLVPAVWGGSTPLNEDLVNQQKLLEEKQKELEAKQANLEKKQKELEKKAETIEVKAKSSPEAELAKSSLGSKASILESLVPIIKSKDPETQKKVSLILENFKASKDEYTRNVGIYLSYLLE